MVERRPLDEAEPNIHAVDQGASSLVDNHTVLEKFHFGNLVRAAGFEPAIP